MSNPYQPPSTGSSFLSTGPGSFGGIGRGQFFVFGFLNSLAQNVFAAVFGDSPLLILVGIIGIVVGLILIFLRLQNLGYSGLYFLLVFIPIANFLPLFQASICPTGYAVTKKLDAIGTVLACLILAAIFIPLLLLLLGAAA
jgi:uncharacterized membrane protein YhaH (DUF805 family)